MHLLAAWFILVLFLTITYQNRNASNVLSPKKANCGHYCNGYNSVQSNRQKIRIRDCSIEKGLPKFTSQILSNYVPTLRYEAGQVSRFQSMEKRRAKEGF